jgi:hypothetical protein
VTEGAGAVGGSLHDSGDGLGRRPASRHCPAFRLRHVRPPPTQYGPLRRQAQALQELLTRPFAPGRTAPTRTMPTRITSAIQMNSLLRLASHSSCGFAPAPFQAGMPCGAALFTPVAPTVFRVFRCHADGQPTVGTRHLGRACTAPGPTAAHRCGRAPAHGGQRGSAAGDGLRAANLGGRRSATKSPVAAVPTREPALPYRPPSRLPGTTGAGRRGSLRFAIYPYSTC